MKTFKSFFVLILVVAGISTAIAGNSDKTEYRNVKNFNAVHVSAGIDLYLKMSDTEEVKIVANDDVIDKIITEVKDGTLHVYMKKSNWGSWNFNGTRKVYVSVKELNEIHSSSGSDVRSENTLTGENLEVKVSSGADVELDVIYKNFSLDTSSGSDAKISGKTKTFIAEASSGSDIKAASLESKICKVNASSGSDITVNVADEIYAKASSGADIRYSGNPGVKDINESSGGDVQRR